MSFLERIFGRGEAARRRAAIALGIEAGAVKVFHGDVYSLRRTLHAAERRLDVACTCEGR